MRRRLVGPVLIALVALTWLLFVVYVTQTDPKRVLDRALESPTATRNATPTVYVFVTPTSVENVLARPTPAPTSTPTEMPTSTPTSLPTEEPTAEPRPAIQKG